MKSISSNAVLRRVFRSVFFAVSFASVSLFAISTTLAQTNKDFLARPKAILVAEWTDAGESLQAKITPLRARVIANNLKVAAAPDSASNNKPNFVSAKLPALFAALKPTSFEEQAFGLVNEQRRLQNLPPLELDLAMLYVAREHSQNMASFNFFSHKGQDGKTADGRANEVGVKDWRAIGENIAFSQGIKNSVEFAVQCWMYSPHHKENLLNKRWTRSGIGIAQTPDGKFYITQVFRN